MWQARVESGEELPDGPVGGDENEIGVFPLDIHNAKLLDMVAPEDWKNPERYDEL